MDIFFTILVIAIFYCLCNGLYNGYIHVYGILTSTHRYYINYDCRLRKIKSLETITFALPIGCITYMD